MTFDLAEAYYTKYLTFHAPPFSIWLEDVYIGMLASHFKTPVNDVTPNNVPWEQYSVETVQLKLQHVREKGVENTLFVYERTNQSYLWQNIQKHYEI